MVNRSFQVIKDRSSECISCAKPLHRAIFCPYCRHIQLISETIGDNYYDIFDLKEGIVEDKKKLSETLSLKLSLFHPDRFVKNSPLQKEIAAHNSVLCNKGYVVLKDDIKAIEYILSIHGLDKMIGEGSITNGYADQKWVDQNQIEQSQIQKINIEFFELLDMIDSSTDEEELLRQYKDLNEEYDNLVKECNANIAALKYIDLAQSYYRLKFLNNVLRSLGSKLKL